MLILEIENFQGIEYVKLELDGFIVISGPSNRGKSSVIRAIEALVHNNWRKEFLRHGEKQCKITLHLSPDTKSKLAKIEYIRGKKSSSYNLEFKDGTKKAVPRAGNGNAPDEVNDLFHLIVTDRKDKFNMNVQGQLDPLFLIHPGMGEVAQTSFLNHIFGISRFEIALKKIMSDSVQMERDHKTMTNEKQIQVESLEKEEEKLSSIQVEISELEKLYQTYKTLKDKLISLVGARTLFERVEELNLEVGDLESLSKITEAVYSLFESSCSRFRKFLEKQEDRDGVVCLEIHSEEAKTKFTRVENLSNRFEEASSKVDSLADQSSLRDRLNYLDVEIDRVQISEGYVSKLSKFVEDIIGSLDKKMKKSVHAFDYDQRAKAIDGLASKVVSMEEVGKESVRYRNLVMKAFGVCPTCKQKLGECQDAVV
jgi:DNA repair ATPase RecN